MLSSWQTGEQKKKRIFNFFSCAVQVEDYGWPDLHAPPLDRICAVCKAMETWLTSDSHNVVVLYCKVSETKIHICQLCCEKCETVGKSCYILILMCVLTGKQREDGGHCRCLHALQQNISWVICIINITRHSIYVEE